MRARASVGAGVLSAALGIACGSTGTQAPAATAAPVSVVSVARDAGPAPALVPASAPVTTEAREDRRIARMLGRVTEARKLAALKAVPGRMLGRDALLAKVRAHVDIEVPHEAIVNEGLALKILGFLPPGLDYLKTTFDLLEAQLAGFYEPVDGTMYMAADLDGDNTEATLAHELDHALQDQHFGLAAHSKYEPGKSDEQLAFSALAEGDATSTMADVLLAKAGKTALDLPEEVFVEQVLASVNSGEAAHASHVMRTSLVAPYVYGTLFVHALRRQGGWAAVDEAWRAMPTTTEQILHVEKWRAHEPALAVKAPTFAALGAGWTLADEDTEGELGMRLVFEEWMGADQAARAAEGWGGDRTVLVRNGEKAALAVHVRSDVVTARPAPARGVDLALLGQGLAKYGAKVVKSAGWVCVERASVGPLGVMKKERELVIVAGPATSSASAWAPAGDCAGARKWAEEIAAQK